MLGIRNTLHLLFSKALASVLKLVLGHCTVAAHCSLTLGTIQGTEVPKWIKKFNLTSFL